MTDTLKVLVEAWHAEKRVAKFWGERFTASVGVLARLNTQIFDECAKAGIDISTLGLSGDVTISLSAPEMESEMKSRNWKPVWIVANYRSKVVAGNIIRENKKTYLVQTATGEEQRYHKDMICGVTTEDYAKWREEYLKRNT